MFWFLSRDPLYFFSADLRPRSREVFVNDARMIILIMLLLMMMLMIR